MREKLWAMGSLWITLALGGAPVFGQACPAGDDCMSCACAVEWNAAEVTTVTGVVAEVLRVTESRGGEGVHLIVDGDHGSSTVHLGPAWYLDRQDESFQEGDVVSVTGMPVEMGEDAPPTLIAREVEKGDAVLTLRGETGSPVWQGWRGGRHGWHHHACAGRRPNRGARR